MNAAGLVEMSLIDENEIYFTQRSSVLSSTSSL